MPTEPHSPSAGQWNLLPAVFAWFLPGLGHILIGERRRGSILFVTLGTLWLAGFLIGGISVFDRTERHAFWSILQSMAAPSVPVILVVDHWRTVHPELTPDSNPPFSPSFGREFEQGQLFTGMAGLLNLLAVVDVLYRDPRQVDRDAARPKRLSAGEQP